MSELAQLAAFLFIAGQILGWEIYIERTEPHEQAVWDACL